MFDTASKHRPAGTVKRHLVPDPASTPPLGSALNCAADRSHNSKNLYSNSIPDYSRERERLRI